MEFDLSAATLVPFLFIFTIAVVVVVAFISKRRTEERKKSDSAPKSTLADDAPDSR